MAPHKILTLLLRRLISEPQAMGLLWEAMTCWKVRPEGDLSDAQAILTHEAGETTMGPGIQNEHLADVAACLHKLLSLPIIPYGGVAVCLRGKVPFTMFVGRQADSLTYMDTWDVTLVQAKHCWSNGWSRVIMVGFPDHYWRLKKVCEKLRLIVIVPEGLENHYDRRSLQWWCRRRAFFLLCELVKRIEYIATDKI